MLEAQRHDLLEQLAAVDKAIAALGEGAVAVAVEESASEKEDEVAPAAAARQVKPKRVLSDSHKQALVVANRKARHAREVSSGRARELPDDSFVPAIGTRGESQPPRLVKKARKT